MKTYLKLSNRTIHTMVRGRIYNSTQHEEYDDVFDILNPEVLGYNYTDMQVMGTFH